ncbi:MAG: YIP1 family protein [Lachnospiraceae bacterium]|nr:YIP1 family protein [Lachnospiraceae bacterium]
MLYAEKLKYVFYVIFHPADGFWDLKREKRGSLSAALTFVALTVLTLGIEKLNTAFLFNENRISEVNVMVDVITVLLVFTLWCVANWCTTSLMDGKGRMKDIFTAIGYALFPIILIRLPLVLVSFCITAEEGAFYYIFGFIAYAWTAILIFMGTMMTHEYSLGKTVFTCIITVLGMGIILFIGLLFFNVISEIIVFVSTIYKEVRFR